MLQQTRRKARRAVACVVRRRRATFRDPAHHATLEHVHVSMAVPHESPSPSKGRVGTRVIHEHDRVVVTNDYLAVVSTNAALTVVAPA